MSAFLSHSWLVSPALLIGGFATSAIIAFLTSWLAVSGGPVDKPRDRGSHQQPTPTSGGLAVMAATAIVSGGLMWLFHDQIPGKAIDGLLLLGFAGLMGLSGGIDDLTGLPARLRLLFQVGLCVAFAVFYRVTSLDFGFGLSFDVWSPLGLIGSAAWLVLGINAINFMDGSNGLAVGTQAMALMAMAVLTVLLASSTLLGFYIGLPLIILACASGAHFGFLPVNLPMGRAFQGDAGSLFGGALITGACLQLKTYGVASVWFGGFLLAPLLVDVVLTLTIRALQRKPLMEAHKEHLYQLWLQRKNASHGRLALWVWNLTALSALVGVAARYIDETWKTDIRFPVLVVLVAGLSVAWFAIRRYLLRLEPLNGPTRSNP